MQSEYILPPNINGRPQGSYLEIEVSRISFALRKTGTSIKIVKNNLNNNINKNTNNNYYHISNKNKKTPVIHQSISDSQGAIAKFIWWGENRDSAASVRISHSRAKEPTTNSLHRNNNTTEQAKGPSSTLQCHNKLRYSIGSSLALFLDYLRSCEPLEVVVATSSSNLLLGKAFLRLPGVLIRKFEANYTNGCTFEHKTKIYALYKNDTSSSLLTTEHQHPTTDQFSNLEPRYHHKTGEIQLRFKMLFAPSVKHGPVLQGQLNTLQREHDVKEMVRRNIATIAPQLQSNNMLLTNGADHNEELKVENSIRKKLSSSKPEEIVEAMKKLDAKLVAYLAGDEMMLAPSLKEEHLALKRFKGNASPIKQFLRETMEKRFREQQLQIFKRISSVKIEMDVLTLQPEGVKRIEAACPIFTIECQLSQELIKNVARYDMFHLMQFESNVASLQDTNSPNIIRFGQEAQRDIQLPLTADGCEVVLQPISKSNFGRINFIIWSREAGTCLNEMLGMGVLELEELYNAFALEQFKHIKINRRGVHLASLHFKISLLLQRQFKHQYQQQQQQQQQQQHQQQQMHDSNNVELLPPLSLMRQCGEDGKSGEAEKKGNHFGNQKQNRCCTSDAAAQSHVSGKANAASDEAANAANAGEYAELFLYPKDTKIQ